MFFLSTYNLFLLIIPECDIGLYGIRCNETCGNCRNESQCSNVNGTCLTGCNAGFKGDLCKTRKYANIRMHADIPLQHDFFGERMQPHHATPNIKTYTCVCFHSIYHPCSYF